MNQAWVTVAGLCLDFAGVALIAWEWLLAQRAERAALTIAEAHERQEASRSMLGQAPGQNEQMQRHLAAVAQMEGRRTKSRLEESRGTFARRRFGAVYTGMLFVLLGFVLQLLGAIPGCCRVVGIVPAG